MPIKPENRALYPADWKTVIRPEVLERDSHRCKVCRVPNGVYIVRSVDAKTYATIDCEVFNAETGEHLECVSVLDAEYREGSIKIVLTVAHLNHDPTDNGEPGNRPNLAALCQMHHLRHDQAMHLENSTITRHKKRGQEDLFA